MISALATRLVQTAPHLDPRDVASLVAALRANATPLGLSLARAVELVAAARVDAAVALPAIAEACDTLCDPRSDPRALDAARYRIDTLEPIPDVPLSRVRQRRT